MKVIKKDNKIRVVYGSAVDYFDLDYTLPISDLKKMLSIAISIAITHDSQFLKLQNKTISVYEGGNHIDIIHEGKGSLGLLTVEDHLL